MQYFLFSFKDTDNENAAITCEDIAILETVARLLGLEEADLQQVYLRAGLI